jgi:hypothetical protein
VRAVRPRHLLRLAPALVALAFLPMALPSADANQSGDKRQNELAAARHFTAGLRTPAKAAAAGWFDSGLPCFDNPGPGDNHGGMGFHWLRKAPDNSRPDPAKPEALVFEPRSDGSQRLVAVEYLVDFATWPSTQPPTLFGHNFTLVTLPNGAVLYKLHAWLWRPNPGGMFDDFNPRSALCP